MYSRFKSEGLYTNTILQNIHEMFVVGSNRPQNSTNEGSSNQTHGNITNPVQQKTVLKTHVDMFIIGLNSLHLQCVKTDISFETLLGKNLTNQNILYLKHDLSRLDITINNNMDLIVRIFKFDIDGHSHMRLAKDISTVHNNDIRVNIEECKQSIDIRETFIPMCNKIHKSIITNLCMLEYELESQTCLVCGVKETHKQHTCDFFGVANIQLTPQNPPCSFGIVVRYHLFGIKKDQVMTPCIEIEIINPLNILSAVCGIIDFIVKIYPDLSNTLVHSALINTIQITTLPVAVTSIRDVVSWYVEIIGIFKKYSRQQISILHDVLMNIGMVYVSHGCSAVFKSNFQPILLPFSTSDEGPDNHNNKNLFIFLREMKQYSISQMFVSSSPYDEMINNMNELQFRVYISEICADEIISSLVTLATEPWHKTKQYERNDIRMHLLGGLPNRLGSVLNKTSFIKLRSYLSKITALFNSRLKKFAIELLGIDSLEEEIKSDEIDMIFFHVRIRFLFYIFQRLQSVFCSVRGLEGIIFSTCPVALSIEYI
jgi:hypothetical protein